MTMHERFRLAIVGAGMITRVTHLPAALTSSGVDVAVLVDPVEGRAAALAQEYGIAPRIVRRIEEAADGIDGAVIATPNHTHMAIAVACLERGIPVLVEKPLAGSYQAGLAILAAAERAGKPVAVGYSTRFRENVRLLKRLLDAEYFGAVRRFVHQFGTPGGWSPLSAYNLDCRTAGGGVLVVTGTHFLDRMLYLWGYPDSVAFEDDSRGGPEANCVARFGYTGGRVPLEGAVRYSKTVRLPPGLVIDTECGYVVVGDHEDADIVIRRHSCPSVEELVRPRMRVQPGNDVARLQLEDFVAACREGRSPLVDGRQGLESLRLLEQLYGCRRTLRDDWYEEAVPARAAA